MRSAIILSVLVLSACATPGPIIDPSVNGKTDAEFRHDLIECKSLVEANTSTAGSALTGAAIGAGVFALTGALMGVNGVGSMAGLGAALGGAQGAGSSVQEKNIMMQRCLQGRGYSVLR